MGRRISNVFLALMTWLVVSSAFAFDEADLEQLKATGICKNCDLTEADLTGADLAGANLGGANLFKAELIGVNLSGAFLTRANLASANFKNADLTGANLTGANLAQAIFCNTIMPDGETKGKNCSEAILDSKLVDLIEALDDTVVVVSALDDEGNFLGHGTAFFISEDGQLLTNAHVVDKGSQFEILTQDKEIYRVKVISATKDLDIAQLKVINPDRAFKAATLGDSNKLKKGQRVFSIGNPGIRLNDSPFLEHSLAHGYISGLDRQSRGWPGVDLIELDLTSYGGQSGSPLFDMKGRVIGIVSGGPFITARINMPDDNNRKAGSSPEYLPKMSEGKAYAVPISYLERLEP
jgi:S1-C subfamily serine protease